ncbi:MAG: hypothetical protein ACREV5_03425 [Steroidobacter sp.]
MRTTRAAACSALLAMGACAGDGDGLDVNGRPEDEAAQPLQATFASIQDNVFTPICTTCHAGAAAPLGLRLDAGASYVMLVNAPGVEAPALLRVAPGNPDASYLIQKLEGTAAVGARMPLNGSPLPAETIAVIRQWILAGAQQTVAAGAEGKAATIEAAWPMPGAVLREPPREILLSASAELDATLLEAGTVIMQRSGGDGDFTNHNEQLIAVSIALRSIEPTAFAVTMPGAEWIADHYELRVSGGAPLALAERAARPIDGDNDGGPGGDFVLRFRMEESR